MKRVDDSIFTIYFHVGAGKTGSSSIQSSLNSTKKELNALGYDYWGLMLEQAPCKKYIWQNPAAYNELITLDKDIVKSQILDVITESIEVSLKKGITTAVWSNEFFFSRANLLSEVITELNNKKIKLNIVAYVRRHDFWALSAYKQWGLKHKNYKGKIISFDEYFKKRPVAFYPALNAWLSCNINDIIVKNYDNIKDVVSNFAEIINSPVSLSEFRSNESLTNEEFYLRALFNNTQEQEADPSVFDNFFDFTKIDINKTPSTWFKKLQAQQENIQEILFNSKDDIKDINKILSNEDQIDLNDKDIEVNFNATNHEILIAALYQMLIREKFRNNTLAKKVKKIENHLNLD